jgi:hypothetical protein
MASRRALVSATTTDALQNELIKDVVTPSIVNLWATSVTVTDTIGLSLDQTTIVAPGTCNVSAAALGMVDTARDQLLFNSVVGIGKLRMPVTVTTSAIYLISVEPILRS